MNLVRLAVARLRGKMYYLILTALRSKIKRENEGGKERGGRRGEGVGEKGKSPIKPRRKRGNNREGKVRENRKGKGRRGGGRKEGRERGKREGKKERVRGGERGRGEKRGERGERGRCVSGLGSCFARQARLSVSVLISDGGFFRRCFLRPCAHRICVAVTLIFISSSLYVDCLSSIRSEVLLS